jgi:peptidoglycan-associated lipoprotein
MFFFKNSGLKWLFCGLMILAVAGCRSSHDDLEGYDTDVLAGGDVLDVSPVPGDEPLAPRCDDFGTPVEGVAFESVGFPFDSFQIAASERGKIEQVASYLNDNPAVHVVIDGHCDERGSREYNLSLGEHRALAVREYLITLGVSGDRIQTRSFGEEQPLDPGHNEAAWRINRRGEFALYR